MNKKNVELYTGVFVIIGCACIAYLIIVLGGMDPRASEEIHLHAFFSSVSGLKEGAGVEIAGVNVGSVTQIAMDKKRMVARVTLGVDKSIEIPEDSIASVKTSGIIGEKFISLSPGGSDIILGEGDELMNTESTVDIEGLIRKFIFNNESK